MFIIYFVALFITITANAFEWLPEFQSLTEEEQSAFEKPVLIENEYQSDVLTYLKPFEWEYLWLSHQKAFDLSVGSVSARHFMMDNRLKVHTFLTGSLEFRFTHFDESNLERESMHNILELVAWPWDFLGISAYGEPSLYKRKNDTGLALLIKPHSRHEIRFFNTFVDVTRLKRSDRPDTFVEPYLPYSRGMVGRVWSDPETKRGEFLEYAFRYETKTRWQFPTEMYEYEYWKLFYSLFFDKQLNEKFHVQGRVQFDRKFEARWPTSATSSTVNESWKTDRLFVIARTVLSDIGPYRRWRLTTGVEYAYRFWQTEPGSVLHRNILPHFLFELPAFGEGATEDMVGIGYDFNWHRALGPESLRYVHDIDAVVDHRVSVSYDFRFRDNATIRLNAAFDLDRFGTKQTWQGGNGQMQLYF